MIYELRTYWVAPGRLDELVNEHCSAIAQIQEKFGFEYVGFWTVTEPSPEGGADLVYLLKWPTMDVRNDSWKQFLADPEWLARHAEADAAGPLVLTNISTFLEATAFSKLQ